MDNGALPEGLNSHKIEDGVVAPTAFRRPPMAPELIDTIIDMLHTDRAVLATCALVSRSWLPASRYHLFSKVTVTRKSSPVISNLLSSPRCTIASAVKHLALHTIEDLSQSICGLSNVTQMSLRGFMLYRTSTFPPPILIPLLRNIESLRVEDVYFGRDGALLLALLHHTPQLQSLLCNDLGGIGEEAVQTPSLDEVELTPRLKSLRVYSDDRPVQLEWFVAWWKNTIPPLAMLVLEFHGATELNKLVALFEAVGSSLQVFELCGNAHGLSPTAPYFTFLTQLQSLSIECVQPDEVPDRSLDFPIQALGNLTSPQLQELTITLHWLDVKDALFPSAAWSELDSLLEAQFISTLRVLVIRFRLLWKRTPSAHDTEQKTALLFPLCAARGILRVEFVV